MKCLPLIDAEGASNSAKRVIPTGGPGAGKTTVLHGLKLHGYPIIEESARAIIRERLRRDLPPKPEPREFAIEVMQRDITNYRSTEAASGCVFFDRGRPDALCMLTKLRLLDCKR